MDNQLAKITGVFFEKRRLKWQANIKVNGKNKFLGYFDNQEDAAKVRKLAEIRYQKPKIDARLKFEKDVCEYYLTKKTLEETGLKFNRDSASIYEILIKNNIQTRSNKLDINWPIYIDRYKNGEKIADIAKELNVSHCTVCNYIHEAGLEIKIRDYPIDENMFDNIDCEWKAYFLGLLFADGNVRKNYLAFVISLTEKDKYILDYFSNKIFGFIKLDYRGCIKIYGKNNKEYISKPSFRLTVCSKKLCYKLKEYGCEPKKSLILEWPKNIPDNMIHHFIRGYFDGDGHISKEGKVFTIVSSDKFCEDFSKFLKNELDIDGRIVKAGKVSRFMFYRQDKMQKIKEFMYKDATIFLQRKRDRFR